MHPMNPPTAADLMEAADQAHRLVMAANTPALADTASRDYTLLIAAAAIVAALDRLGPAQRLDALVRDYREKLNTWASHYGEAGHTDAWLAQRDARTALMREIEGPHYEEDDR